ncbi:MAG: DUF4232 domain-containing protein [Nocardioides sp.]|uniref:DUF4232 domain-containing protein n=1 Tax=Nocardioides sp. TaxID=35761 RepID=UPI0039E3893B
MEGPDRDRYGAEVALHAAWMGALVAAGAVVATGVITAVLSRPGPTGPAPAATPTTSSTPADLATGVVPWSNRTDYEEWIYTHPTEAPCHTADLKPLPSDVEGAGQHLGWFLKFRNHGAAACTLGGYPTVQTRTSGGSWTTVGLRRGTFFPVGYTPGTVRPGADPAELTLEFPANETTCPSAPSGLEIRLMLDDGTALPVIAPEGSTQTCAPIAVSQWHAGLVEQPDRFPGLQIRLETPASVRPGSTLEYVVTLTNRGDETVDLRPCPGYEQSLSAYDTVAMSSGEALVRGRWRLECGSTPLVAPGASVRYAMRLDAPTDVRDSPEIDLRWNLVDLSPDYDGQEWLQVVP